MSSVPASARGLFATIPDAVAAEAREAADDVLRPERLYLEEVPVVDDARDDVADVVGLVGVVGHDRVELLVLAVDRIRGLEVRGGSALFCGRKERR